MSKYRIVHYYSVYAIQKKTFWGWRYVKQFVDIYCGVIYETEALFQDTKTASEYINKLIEDERIKKRNGTPIKTL